VGGKTIAVYATRAEDVPAIHEKLANFAPSLPAGVGGDREPWHRLLSSIARFRPKLIGRTTEVPAEVRNTVQVGADGCIGEVAATQLLKHELT
jgi:hypothetical protein